MKQLYAPAQQQTIALVVVPKFEEAAGKHFLSIGPVAMYDSHTRNGLTETKYTFKREKPVILVFRTQANAAFGRSTATKTVFGDTTLFDIAEIWISEGKLTDDQTRHLETYLALKYAVNISQNKEERYRSYFTAKNKRQWHSPTEGRYNQEILGVGRMDAFGWQQTQTQNNPEVSGLAFTVALDEVKPQGQMKDVPMADNSYLIFSKAANFNTAICPAPSRNLPFYGWKIKRTAWQSPAKYVQFVATSAISSLSSATQDTVLLTDGQATYFLPVSRQGNTQQITIPIALLADGTNYFLLPTQSNPLCEEKIKIAVDSLNNAIGLAISPEQLPLTLQLNDLIGQNTTRYFITEQFTVIHTGQGGQYQLDFTASNASSGYSTVVNLNGAPTGGSGMAGYSSGSVHQLNNTYLKNQLIAEAEGTSLLAYPNPAKENSTITFMLLNPTPGNYTVHVSDARGKLLYINTHEITPENNTWHYHFGTPGTYTVAFILNQKQYTQTIIIQ